MEQQLRWPPAGRRVAARDFGGAFLLALAIAAAFAAILLQTINFPLAIGYDEPSKALQVLGNWNNYNHPLLMLQLARAANAIAGFADPQSVGELGRTLAVLAGALAIFATYLLAREVLPAPAALAACLAASVVPAITVHARYFKEDIFALPFLLLSLVALIETLKAPTHMRALLLGITIGLAASAKYVAAIALPFAVAVLLIHASAKEDWRSRLRLAGLATLAAGAVLALVELPALWNLAAFRSSLIGNLVHASEGHDVRLPVSLTYGIFHLRQSLLPSLGMPLLILGLLGLAAPWLAPSERRRPLLVIALFALLWYAVHELSPLKPYPNFQRYMVPLAPLLVILGTAFLYEISRRRVPRWSAPIAAVVILAAAAPALYTSLRIAGPPEEDVRRIVPRVVLKDTPQAAFDRYTRLSAPQGSISAGPPESTTPSIFVTSNFVYDRFAQVGARGQRARLLIKAGRYAALFALPYLEVTNGRPAYGWFNPVLRIVALDGDAEHLKSIAAVLQRMAPNMSLSLVDAGTPEANCPRQTICW